MDQLALEGITSSQPSQRVQIVQALAEFRREWQGAVEGKSLLEVEVPVGLLLSDIADRLGLNSQERYAVLGGKLVNQVNSFLEDPINMKAE